MVMNDFAKTNRAEVMLPIVSSPFPRWISQWSTRLVGRELYGVALPSEGDILASSFTCNVWEGCLGD